MEAMEVLGRAVYGCYLLTVAAGDDVNGMPLSLFMQVGFKPPRVACGVSPRRRTHEMLTAAGSFGVVFLRKDQSDLIARFKQPGEGGAKKFEGLAWRRGRTGAPILADCLAYLECRLVAALDPGDHTLFIGEVVEAEVVREGELLTVQDLGKYYGG